MAPASPAPGKAKGILTATIAQNSGGGGGSHGSSTSSTPLKAGEVLPAGAAGSATPAKPAAPISPANTVQLHQLVTGCKVMVERPGEDARKAEILSIRAGRQARGARPKPGEEVPKPTTEYYVHYVEFNKRLDEWVPSTRLLMSEPVEWPIPKDTAATSSPHGSPAPTKVPSKRPDPGLRKTAIKQAVAKAGQHRGPMNKAQQKKRKLELAAAANAAAAAASAVGANVTTEDDGDASMMNIDSPSTRSVSLAGDRESSTDPATPKEGTPDEDDEDEDNNDDAEEAVVAVEVMDDNEDAEADEDADPDAAAPPNSLEKHSHFSKEQEIEQLRSHGSMTQSVHEIARVKNLDRIQMGQHEVEAWYFSPYPVEYAHIPILYICEFCLSFFGSPKMLQRHRRKCTLLHPPGNEIYRHEDISFYEIDGKKQKTWCRHLCLLSKCFLDHKTLYYDVDPFLYYVMCKRDDMGVHTIGYFSKEKESAENYNVACILTLPQYQRHGYGKMLIEFSYELSKKEGKTGSPEKPLSDLGLLSYRAYWQETIVDYILDVKGTGKDTVSIDEIANKTSIVHADIMHTAQTLQMLKFYQNQHVLCLSDALLEQHERIKKKKRRRINPDALIWKPPQFSKEQLKFGW